MHQNVPESLHILVTVDNIYPIACGFYCLVTFVCSTYLHVKSSGTHHPNLITMCSVRE